MSSRTSSSADLLLKISAIYSRLSPFFGAVRADPQFAGNTLLPNALSPLAPAMAYGYCGRLSHGDARRRLQELDEWRTTAARLENLYAQYNESQGNALLWAGWNYWDPAASDQPLKGRMIQVMLARDLAERQELFRADRVIIGRGQNAVRGSDLLEQLKHYQPYEVKIGALESGDVELLPQSLLTPRLFSYNLWDRLFVPSASQFVDAGTPSIVDYLKDGFDRGLPTALRPERSIATPPSDDKRLPASLFLQDIEILFPQEGSTLPDPSNDDGVRSFVCRPEWTAALWAAVDEKLQETALTMSGESAPLAALQNAWRALTNEPPRTLQPAFEALSGALKNPLPQNCAYAILQHLALFDKFLGSSYQYVIPIAYGRHLFVAYFATKNRLISEDLLGWRQVVSALFGSLIVERVSDRLHRRQLQEQLEERQNQLRLVLNHAMPKAVFQPAQFFAAKLLATRNGNAKTDGSDDENIHALLFLLAKGQSDMAALTADGGVMNEDATISRHGHEDSPVELFKACNSLKSHFDAIKDFLLAAQMGRQEREAVKHELSCEVASVTPSPLVRLNRGVLFFHLWNLVDNAFRHGGLAARARNGGAAGISIEISIGEPDSVEDRHRREGALLPRGWANLRFQNAGDPISSDSANRLNELLSTDSQRLDTLIRASLGAHDRIFPDVEMEDDHAGRGLAQFSRYLAQLWSRAGEPERARGRVSALKEGTLMEFHFPLDLEADQ